MKNVSAAVRTGVRRSAAVTSNPLKTLVRRFMRRFIRRLCGGSCGGVRWWVCIYYVYKAPPHPLGGKAAPCGCVAAAVFGADCEQCIGGPRKRATASPARQHRGNGGGLWRRLPCRHSQRRGCHCRRDTHRERPHSLPTAAYAPRQRQQQRHAVRHAMWPATASPAWLPREPQHAAWPNAGMAPRWGERTVPDNQTKICNNAHRYISAMRLGPSWSKNRTGIACSA
jgi:hypothetical protein